MNVDNIQALIAQKKIVLLSDIVPTEAYIQIGVFQNGNRQNGAGNANTYAPYVIPISEFIGGGGGETLAQTLVLGNTTGGNDISITSGDVLLFNRGLGGTLDSSVTAANRTWTLPDATGTLVLGSGTAGLIPKWDAAASTLVDGNWQFIVDDIMPVISGSNIGNNLYRVGTMFMNGSVFDYAGNVTWVNTAVTNMTLTAAGDLGVGIAPTARLHTSGSTNDNTAYAFHASSLAGTNWLSVRNDGAVDIFGGGGNNATLSVHQRSYAFPIAFEVYGLGYENLLRVTETGAAGSVTLGNYFTVDTYTKAVAIAGTLNVSAQAAGDVLTVTAGAGGYFVVSSVANDPFLYMQSSNITNIGIRALGDSFFNGGSVSIGSILTNGSAILDLTSTTKGFLTPRMTTAQKTAIVGPAESLLVYDDTLNDFDYFDGANWQSVGKFESLALAASDETTALTAGTGKMTFRMPYAMKLSEVRASLTTAQGAGNIFTVNINEAGATILSTKITIDNTEKTSTTAATPPVISDVDLANDAEITIDIDQIGDGTATGLKVYLIGRRIS